MNGPRGRPGRTNEFPRAPLAERIEELEKKLSVLAKNPQFAGKKRIQELQGELERLIKIRERVKGGREQEQKQEGEETKRRVREVGSITEHQRKWVGSVLDSLFAPPQGAEYRGESMKDAQEAIQRANQCDHQQEGREHCFTYGGYGREGRRKYDEYDYIILDLRNAKKQDGIPLIPGMNPYQGGKNPQNIVILQASRDVAGLYVEMHFSELLAKGIKGIRALRRELTDLEKKGFMEVWEIEEPREQPTGQVAPERQQEILKNVRLHGVSGKFAAFDSANPVFGEGKNNYLILDLPKGYTGFHPYDFAIKWTMTHHGNCPFTGVEIFSGYPLDISDAASDLPQLEQKYGIKGFRAVAKE